MTYNARGQTERIVYGNGVAATYGYNARGWMTRVQAYTGATTLMDQSYTRLDNGQITAVTAAGDAGRSWAYAYDGFGRLTLADNLGGTAEDRSFGYDAGDNLIFNSKLCAVVGTVAATGAPYNMAYPAQGAASIRPHAPASICGVAVSYDANGNTLAYDADGPGPKPARMSQ